MSDALEYSLDGVEQVPLRRFTEEAYLKLFHVRNYG